MREVARPTKRLTHRTAQLAVQRGRGALRGAHSASRRVAQSLGRVRASSERYLVEARHELRTSLLPGARTRMKSLSALLSKSMGLLFLGGIATGTVYGLSGSGSQTLTTGVCALTLWLLFAMRETQQREASALRRSLDELRASLRVTHALLEASELSGAEELRSTLLPACVEGRERVPAE